MDVRDKSEIEDTAWEAGAESLAAKQKRLIELDKEKQEDPALELEDIEQMYGQQVGNASCWPRQRCKPGVVVEASPSPKLRPSLTPDAPDISCSRD